MDLERLVNAAEGGERLKDSPLRCVHRVQVDGRSLILKEVRVEGVLERLRAVWLRSRVRVEDAMLREAKRRGIPCPEPLQKWIEAGIAPRRAWLALSDLGPGAAVADRLATLEDPEARVRLLTRCSALIADCARRGLLHRDLHLGNLYWRAADDALFVLDLHRARFGEGPLRLGRSALLGLWLSLPWPDQARERAALFSALDCAPTGRHARRTLRRHLAARLDRALRPSGAFRRLDAAVLEWALVRRTFANALPGLDCAGLRRATSEAELIKGGRRGVVVQLEVATATGPLACVAKSRKEARSLEAWVQAEALALRRIPHATALATFEVRDVENTAQFGAKAGRVRVRAGDRFVLSARVDPALSIDALETRDAEMLASAFGQLVGRLHATGLRCRDPRLDNFVVQRGARGLELCLVDLDGIVALPHLAPRRAIASDLGRALAWLRFEAPPSLRGRTRALAARAFAAWRAEVLALGEARFASPCDSAHIARTARYRCDQWKRRHDLKASTTSAPAAAGSDSGATSSRSSSRTPVA